MTPTNSRFPQTLQSPSGGSMQVEFQEFNPDPGEHRTDRVAGISDFRFP